MRGISARTWQRSVLVLLLCLAAACGPAQWAAGADLPSDKSKADVTLREFLERRADLLLIRAMFNVVLPEDILPALEADARRIGSGEPTVNEVALLNDQLLTEGSYLLVSIAYTVQAGGALWPSDKAEAVYQRDAEVMLDGLRDQFLDAIEQRSDLLPVLKRIDEINALTNGETSAIGELDHFGNRDALVEETITRASPRVET